MQQLLSQLRVDYPDITFVEGTSFYWSARDRSVTYAHISTQPEVAEWSLLHEVSHGILGHTDYKTDFELTQLEVAAWQHARRLSKTYGITIDPEHIQDCLDTYRDWLHRRSTCPSCAMVSTQVDSRMYRCYNCKTTWRVSNSRFCRPYRRVSKAK